MNALTFVKSWTRGRWKTLSFVLVCLFPILGNVISRLAKHGKWLNDFDALICGAYTIGQGQSPYSLHPTCAGLHPAPFVYAPQVGQIFAPFVSAFGLEGSRIAYLWLLIPIMAVLLWYALVKPLADTPWQFRLMPLAAIAGSALTCGNIGLILHGLVILAALALKKSRLPFVVVVIMGALIKPVFLTYLIVLLYEDRPFLKRLCLTLMAAAAGVAGFATVLTTAGPFRAAWQSSLDAIVIQEQPGIGFFSYTSVLGLQTASPVTLIALVLFLCLIALSGLVLAEWGGLAGDQRIVLGLGMAQLLNPRLMDYDLLALGPAIALIVMQAKPLGEKVFTQVSWAFAGVLLFSVTINVLEIPGIHRAPISVFVFCLITLYVAGLTAWPHMARIRGWLRDPRPVLRDIWLQRV